MSTTTTNYNLIKPELTDAADITATNGNWDVIDVELVKLKDKLPLNGSVPMSGNLMIANSSDPSVYAKHSTTGRSVRAVSYTDKSVRLENTKNSQNYTGIDIRTENDGLDGILRLVVMKDGTWNPYDIFHEGNVAQIKPNDIGAVDKNGDIMKGILQVAISGGNATLATDSAGAYIQAYEDNDWNHRRTLIIKNMDSAKDLVSAVTLGVQDDGTWQEYALIHQKNLNLIKPDDIGAAKIETGSYVGTGTFGESYPNTITFSFEPKMVFVLPDISITNHPAYETVDDLFYGLPTNGFTIFTQENIAGCGTTNSGFLGQNTFMPKNWGRTLKWWTTATESGAYIQGNASGKKYFYFAIG